MRRIVWLILLMVTSTAFSQMERSQVEFVATVSVAESFDSHSGILSMQLTDSYHLSVRVTSRTELRDENDFPLALADIREGMKLKVEGVFTSEGILADEIRVTQDRHELEVRGPISAVDTSARTLTVAGLTIALGPGVEIRTEEGQWLTIEDLQNGQFAHIEGVALNGTFQAREVKISTFGLGRSRLNFEGTVSSINGSQVLVSIEGVGDALVNIQPDTVIRGTLAAGARVRVFGSIGSDLSVDATLISVIMRLQVNPDEIRLDFLESRRVDVFLASAVDSDSSITLSTNRPEIAVPDGASLVIPAGKMNGFFMVMAGSAEGDALIEVSLPESLGGGTAVLEIEVENDRGRDDGPGDDHGNNGGDDGPGDDHGGQGNNDDGTAELFEIDFSPGEIRGLSGQTRVVQLVLNRTTPAALDVALFLVEGVNQPVVFPSLVTIPANSNFVDIAIQTGAMTANAKIRAQLPAEVGGDTSSLNITAEAAGAELLEIRWSPDKVRMGRNQTTQATLILNGPAPAALEITLSLKSGVSGLVQFPASAMIPAGSGRATVTVTSGPGSGEMKIRAGLPFSVGGDTSDLEIEVEN